MNAPIEIPNNIILKSIYPRTISLLSPNYINDIIEGIMDYILTTDKVYHKNIEIESKLGQFNFISEKAKVFSYINETFRIPDNKSNQFQYKFISGISPSNFYSIWNAIERECNIRNSGIRRIEPIVIKDTFYENGIRVSKFYKGGDLIKEETIKKENRIDFNVRNYGNDFRITCSKEIDTMCDNENSSINKRDKFRISYLFSYFEIDLTISKSNDINERYNYEVEIEIKNLVDLLKGQNWEFNLRTILMRFMQNIINLYTAILPDSINLIDNQERNFKNCYGDYLQNQVKKNINK